MIRSFRDAETEKVFRREFSRAFHSFARIAKRKLDQLHAARELSDLDAPPGNRLERLRGDRADQHSIRVNDQWRICFRWTGRDAEDVEITDYPEEQEEEFSKSCPSSLKRKSYLRFTPARRSPRIS